MPTYKAEVYAHQKKKDGTYNIKIRVIHNKQKKYIATPYFVTQADLTRALKIKNQRYIDYCNELIHLYRTRSDSLGIRINEMNVEEVVQFVTSPPKAEFKLDFIEFVKSRIELEIREGRTGTAKNGEMALRVFEKWLGKDKIDINDISRKMAADYLADLQQRVKASSARTYIVILSKFYNLAEDFYNENETLVRRNPFRALKMPRPQETRKKALTIEQIRAIRDYQPAVKTEEDARDIFMLSFYLIGMNAADMFTCAQLEDGTLTYYREKTKRRRRDNAEIQINIQPEAQELVDKYRGRERVFNFVEHYESVAQLNARVNYGLSRIAKALGFGPFTFYAARHSWATIAATVAGIDIYNVHLALLHASPMPITEVYIKRDFTKINEANRTVLDLIL